MDLSVSPDIEAYFCYLIVASLGAITAIVQINRGLGDLAGIWLIPGTWLLFLMYLGVPIGLFWFLDRTGAISDTSVFAAALIGVGYERIMNGTNQTIATTASLLQFWTPFQTYANEVQKSVLERSKRNEMRLIDGLVSSVLKQPARYQLLENMAVNASSDAAALRTRLAAVDTAAAAAPVVPPAPATPVTPAAAAPARGRIAAAIAVLFGPAAPANPVTGQQRQLLEDKTRVLFTELVKVPDAFYRMKTKGIITWPVYLLDVMGVRRLLLALAALVPVVIVLGVVWSLIVPDSNTLRSDYYVWRLVKANATSIEQNRARSNLLALMNVKGSPVRDPATRNMVQTLRQPGLPVERIDLLLQSLLESRLDGDINLPRHLIGSLRSASVDTRTRINDVLKHFAVSLCSNPFVEKDTWKPSDGDATVSLELRIKAWSDYWTNSCKS